MADEVKKVLDEIGNDFHEYKKVNDERLEKLEKGQGVAELEEKLAKMDAALDSNQESVEKKLEETRNAVERLANSHKSEEQKELDQKNLSGALKKYFSHKDSNMSEAETKALQSNIDPQGGYTVTPFVGAIEKRLFDTSNVRALARSVTIGTDEYVGFLDDNEFNAGWIGEIETRTDTATADIGQVRIPVREMYARFTVTERLLEDSDWNMEAWAQSHVADKFARLEATGFVTGSGANQPKGFMTATQKTSNGDVYTRDQIGTKETASASAITFDELIDLQALLKTGYRANASFMMNRATRSYVRKLKDSESQYLWQPSLQAGEPETLLGDPIAIFEDMADIGSDALTMAYGDLASSYLIVDRVGMSVLRDPYTAANSGKIYMHMRKRVGGGFVGFDSLKYLKQAT